MIDVLYWFACLIVLSVVLAQLEAIKITPTGAVRLIGRAIAWCLIGLSAFTGVLQPFFRMDFMPHHLEMIGIAGIAISYGWQGATRRQPNRRVSDHV